jgi:XTP/dITP diphosphohydrolase
MTLFLATSNPGKLADFAGMERMPALLPGFSEIPAVKETGSTFEANARLKAEYYSGFAPAGAGVIADDSGLEVDALQGAPGVRSARFAGEPSNDQANNALLLERLRDVPPESRSARFVCVLAVAREGMTLATFRGEAEGRILDAARGRNGFGYDPLFFSPEAGCAFAELTPQQKARFSHRGRAARALQRRFEALCRAAS